MPDRASAQSKGAAALRQLLVDKKVIVCVGPGGVGKTTSAAALAIGAARQGRRCAVLTIDPARRLAQALGVEKMGNTPSKLTAELTEPGQVDAMMLETAEAFDDLVRRLVPDDERLERLLNNRLYQIIARHLGGTHEYMAVEKLFELTRSGDYDLVVLDTPPSVNALDFLDAPQRIASFFSDRIQKFFIRRSEEQKRGLFQRLRDRAGEMALTVLGKALGEAFIEDVQDFATAFQSLFGAFRERGEAIEKLLSDPGTAFIVVSGADPVRVAEALEFTNTLKKFGIKPQAFIANRVHVASGGDHDGHDFTEDELLAALPEDYRHHLDTAALAAGLTRARQVRSSLFRRDREGLDNFMRAAGSERVLVVPELDEEVADRGAVEHLLGALGQETRPTA